MEVRYCWRWDRQGMCPFILAPVTKGTHALSQSCCLSNMSWIRLSSICLSLQVRDPGSGLWASTCSSCHPFAFVSLTPSLTLALAHSSPLAWPPCCSWNTPCMLRAQTISPVAASAWIASRLGPRTCLVQWFRVHLPVQGTRVRSPGPKT